MNILFYYPGFHNTARPFEGTSRAIITLAQSFVRDGCAVSICGDRVEKEEAFGQISITLIPHNQDKQHFLAAYDVVIFGTHMGRFSCTPKNSGQLFVLEQQCWHVVRETFLRINDFDFQIFITLNLEG